MNLKAILKHYQANHIQGLKQQIKWFRQQPSLRAAIECACFAKDERGKRYSHQCRIKPVSMKMAFKALLAMSDKVAICDSFHQLWLIVKQLQNIYGIGFSLLVSLNQSNCNNQSKLVHF